MSHETAFDTRRLNTTCEKTHRNENFQIYESLTDTIQNEVWHTDGVTQLWRHIC